MTHEVEGLCGIVLPWPLSDEPSLGGGMPPHDCEHADRVDGCTIRTTVSRSPEASS